MDKLTKLAIKYKTDKWGKHHYTPFYYKLFQGKEDKVRKVVEIGAGEGNSLRMWRDFFPNAHIYSAEIDKNRIFSEDRIEVIKCDQSKVKDIFYLMMVTGLDIDLVIDDGSHKPEDQISTAKAVLPYLPKGCIYVIEDVAEPNIFAEFEDYEATIVYLGKRYDDCLIVIKK